MYDLNIRVQVTYNDQCLQVCMILTQDVLSIAPHKAQDGRSGWLCPAVWGTEGVELEKKSQLPYAKYVAWLRPRATSTGCTPANARRSFSRSGESRTKKRRCTKRHSFSTTKWRRSSPICCDAKLYSPHNHSKLVGAYPSQFSASYEYRTECTGRWVPKNVE